MPKLRNCSKGDSNQGSRDCESDILPLSYRGPHKVSYPGSTFVFAYGISSMWPSRYCSEWKSLIIIIVGAACQKLGFVRRNLKCCPGSGLVVYTKACPVQVTRLVNSCALWDPRQVGGRSTGSSGSSATTPDSCASTGADPGNSCNATAPVAFPR